MRSDADPILSWLRSLDEPDRALLGMLLGILVATLFIWAMQPPG